jgi:squalene synthase HpnC
VTPVAQTKSAPHGVVVPGIDAVTVMGKAKAENFPVALWLLPEKKREQLLAFYGFARFVDDVGDLSTGDRLHELDWVEAELDRAFTGEATHPIFVRLSQAITELGVTREPFAALIEANRQDQRVHRYKSFKELLAYCRLSANPVGRLVLAVFGRRDEAAFAHADQICTGLQLVEHWQDVAEDCRADRVYVPKEDLKRFGVTEADLLAQKASPALRRLMAFEVNRARCFLLDGAPLVAMLSGTAKCAIAGFVGGGLAQLEAIERADYDVLSGPIRAKDSSVAWRGLALWSRWLWRTQ